MEDTLTLTRKDISVDFYYLKGKNVTISHFKDLKPIYAAAMVIFIDTDGTKYTIKERNVL